MTHLDPMVTVIVLLSAAIHPLWNLILKGNKYPETIFLTVLVVSSVFGFIQSQATGNDLMDLWHIGPLVVLSGLTVGVHGLMLVLALGRGDLSVYYPIIRSAPLGIVAIGFFVLQRSYSPTLLLGIALVLGGAFFLQYRPETRLLSEPMTLLFAVAAMLTSAVYSIIDAVAVQQVNPVVMYFGQSIVALATFVVLLRARYKFASGPNLRVLFECWMKNPWRHIVAGSLAYISYYLILWAYHMGGNVAAVTSVRQASIPLSVIGAALILKEPSMNRRLLWACVVTVGIVVIIFFEQPAS